jgi:hypothetical protein
VAEKRHLHPGTKKIDVLLGSEGGHPSLMIAINSIYLKSQEDHYKQRSEVKADVKGTR